MQLSVVSPTFNEAENVARLVDEIKHALAGVDYEIVIVDDDSPDLTWSVAQEISLQDSRVRVLRRMRNRGLGAAVIDGFGAARGDVVACIDADLQHDPSVLPRMLEEIVGGADIVVGSRYVQGGGIGDWNWLRRIESGVATKVTQIILGLKVKDPMSGYFMMRRNQFVDVQAELNGKGFKILLEILVKLEPVTVKEVPYTLWPRRGGKSKFSSKVILQYLSQLWRLSKRRGLCSKRLITFTRANPNRKAPP